MTEPVLATSAEVIKWAEDMETRGLIAPGNARRWATSLLALEGLLGTDEPRDAHSILLNVKELAKRWTLKNNGNPDTAAAYASRAKAAVEEFFRYRAEPASFRAKVRERRRADPRKNADGGATESAMPAPTPTSTVADPDSQKWRDYPLAPAPDGASRAIRYSLPADGLSVSELRKFVFHVWSLCSDFDPFDFPFSIRDGEALQRR